MYNGDTSDQATTSKILGSGINIVENIPMDVSLIPSAHMSYMIYDNGENVSKMRNAHEVS